jgi:hypothetical protein
LVGILTYYFVEVVAWNLIKIKDLNNKAPFLIQYQTLKIYITFL